MLDIEKLDLEMAKKMREFVTKCRAVSPVLDYLEVNNLQPNYPQTPDGWWVSPHEARPDLQRALVENEHWPENLQDAEACFIAAVSTIQLVLTKISQNLEDSGEDDIKWRRNANWVLLCKRRYVVFLMAWLCQTELSVTRQVARHRKDYLFAGHSKAALLKELFPQLDAIRKKADKETKTRDKQDRMIVAKIRDLRVELGLTEYNED
jgi:hypothetical protein